MDEQFEAEGEERAEVAHNDEGAHRNVAEGHHRGGQRENEQDGHASSPGAPTLAELAEEPTAREYNAHCDCGHHLYKEKGEWRLRLAHAQLVYDRHCGGADRKHEDSKGGLANRVQLAGQYAAH